MDENQAEKPDTIDNGIAVENNVTENPLPEAEPPKKRRGRPRKNPELGAESVGNSTTSAGPKKRQSKMSDEKVSSLALQIQGIHQLAAMVTNFPEVALSEKESVMLAKSVADVASHYDLSIDGKTGAFIQLAGAAAMIYVPRVFAIRARMSKPVQGMVFEATNGAASN